MTRIVHAWNALGPERRLAALAALGLFVTMLLPWYQQNAPDHHAIVTQDLNAFAVFSFIEAAVLLVAVGVLVLLFMRAEGRTFHLPGSDGAVVLAGGLWTLLLLVIRLFDKPGSPTHEVVGVQWGIFFALGAAGLLAYTGTRMRAADRPEPPLMRHRRRRRSTEEPDRAWGAFEPATPAGRRSRRPRPGPGDAPSGSRGRAGEAGGAIGDEDAEAWERGEETTAIVPSRRRQSTGPSAVPARQARRSTPAAKAVDEAQLSFEDAETIVSERPADSA